MARYQIILAYDGTGFLGSQRQASSRTAQSELERALRKLGWHERTVYLAGRTDTGTHATGQVAAFDLAWAHGLEKLQDALNANLPRDMAVREVKTAVDDFHPRFDASSRLYRYRLYCAEVRDPMRDRYAWRIWPAVNDLVALADIWPGRHDFGAFGNPPRSGGSTIRTVISSGWQRQADEWIFEIQADAFLYHMVRRLVYAQVAVGQARIPAAVLVQALDDRIDNRLKARNLIPAGLAPACGLTLIEVFYDNLV